MTNYQEKKERVRQEAIDWQKDCENHDYSWGELADWQCYFKERGRRYGLLKEFYENGIC